MRKKYWHTASSSKNYEDFDTLEEAIESAKGYVKLNGHEVRIYTCVAVLSCGVEVEIKQ